MYVHFIIQEMSTVVSPLDP